LKDRISVSEKAVSHFKKQFKEMNARFNFFDNRMEAIIKASPGEAPIKRHEIDQERLKYLGEIFLII
jgi:hypothetical protein